MGRTKEKQFVVPPEAVVCAKLVLSGFGYEVATEHVVLALKELLRWQDRNPGWANRIGHD